MNELTVHPNIYATGQCQGLVGLLERVWLRGHELGDGVLYVISGFANYNGGVRFFPLFRDHVQSGGRIVAIFAGSASQRVTSRQVVREMLDCGADVHIVNRKRLMHVKSYGSATSSGQTLVVTSGNFTGPGMAQNVEMAVLLDQLSTKGMGFSWQELVGNVLTQRWSIQRPTLGDMDAPVWRLLYDEEASTVVLEETDQVTMILRLGHTDTVRINAVPGSSESKGSQYFWLSKDCYDFFPPLTILNRRGSKRTYSCEVNVFFVELGRQFAMRVTFEAENNLDFRLGTGPLRATGLARPGDLVAISRVRESDYELRIFPQQSEIAQGLDEYAQHFIGHRGKKYGFVPNDDLERATGIRIGRLVKSSSGRNGRRRL